MRDYCCLLLLLLWAFTARAHAAGRVNDHCPCSDAPLEPESADGSNPNPNPNPSLCALFDTHFLQDGEQFTLVSEAREILSNANETMPMDLHFIADPLDKSQSHKQDQRSIEEQARTRCQVVMRIVSATEFERARASRSLCPGKCHTLPEVLAPITWFLAATVSPQLLRNAAIAIEGGAVSKEGGRASGSAHGLVHDLRREDSHLTCSMSLLQYMHSSHATQHGAASKGSGPGPGPGSGAGHSAAAVQQGAPTAVTHLTMALYWRRLMECREQKFWRKPYEEFKKKLDEYAAVEQQYNNHQLLKPFRARYLQAEEEGGGAGGKTLGEWAAAHQAAKHDKARGNKGGAMGRGSGGGSSAEGVTGSSGGAKRAHKSGHKGERMHKKPNSRSHAYTDPHSHVLGGRRRVEALVIWIGSEASLPLMQEQAHMLQGQPHIGHSAVVGWGADDRLYGCTDAAAKCTDKQGVGRFKYLPSSAINWMPAGWGCAQRRPLRALSHTLLLYDPTFVVLVDDDTFVNYPMLTQRWGSYLLDTMAKEPIVVGEFMGKEGVSGHVSRKGLFAGGSGYIIGRALLGQLVAPEVWALAGLGVGSGPSPGSLEKDHKFSGDAYRSSLQMSCLSVLADAVEQSSSMCPPEAGALAAEPAKRLEMGQATTGNSCIPSLVPRRRMHAGRPPEVDGDTLDLKDWYWPLPTILQERAHKESPLSTDGTYPFDSMVMPINTRLVDLCANLMSNEGTCQHSDHSMGRCLLYGASGVPVGSLCETKVPLQAVPTTNKETGETLMIGMCFMAPECDLNAMITCHRYKPDPAAGSKGDTKALAAATSKGGKLLALYLAGKPKKLHPVNKGHYKVYSSFWNGTHGDTNNLH